MEQIEAQLTAEITALQEHIRRVGDRELATSWTIDLLDPFERIEEHLSAADLRKAVTALHYAHNRFSVNGHLTERIREILERHGDLVEADGSPVAAGKAEKTPHFAALDPDAPQSAADSSSFEDADEEPCAMSAADADDLFDSFDDGETFEAGVFPPAEAVADSLGPMADPTPGEADADNALSPSETGPLAADELFERPTTGGKAQESDSRAQKLRSSEERASKIRGPKARKKATKATAVDIFSAQVGLDDLQSNMGFTLPESDIANLENKLRAKLEDQVVATLQTHKQCEQQFLLIPRVSRFCREGTMYPCTLKNLAKIYTGLFADIREVAQYRSCSFMNREIPEPGWAVVLPEAPRESLEKSYMEQNQYLRYLASTLKLPSHLVRRRTLTEALYDLIIGRMVLGQRFQKATLDWTATGASKTDCVCIYYPEAGIRLRHLGRHTRNKALGLCPNW